jgi:hypothetical protein
MPFAKMIWGGVTGSLVMTVLMIIGRLIGFTDLDLEIIVGSMFDPQLTLSTWFLGLGLHLAAGITFSFIYYYLFQASKQNPTWYRGAGLGLFHGLLSGFMMGFLQDFHPFLIKEHPVPYGFLMDPGFFALNYGIQSAAAFILLHVVYGGIVGGFYQDWNQSNSIDQNNNVSEVIHEAA